MSKGPYQSMFPEAAEGSVIVKNTFLTVVDDQEQGPGLRRSQSESNLSQSNSAHSAPDAMSVASSQRSNASATSQTMMSTSWLQQMRRLALGDSAEPSAQQEESPKPSQLRQSEAPRQKLILTQVELKAGPSMSGSASASSGASDRGSGSNGSRKKPTKVRLMSVDGPSHRVVDHVELEPDQELIDKIQAETGAALAQLQALERQGALALVPRTPEGTITSVGSMLHAEETCLPCIFWFRKMCSKGVGCSYCHFEHEGQRNKRIRPSKKTREMQRKNQEDSSTASCNASEPEEDSVKPSSTLSL